MARSILTWNEMPYLDNFTIAKLKTLKCFYRIFGFQIETGENTKFFSIGTILKLFLFVFQFSYSIYGFTIKIESVKNLPKKAEPFAICVAIRTIADILNLPFCHFYDLIWNKKKERKILFEYHRKYKYF